MALFIVRFSPAHITYSSFLAFNQMLVQEKARVIMLRDPCAISLDTLLLLPILLNFHLFGPHDC
jgi:hypothetical protein